MLKLYRKLAKKIFGKFPDRYPYLFSSIKNNLPKSGINISHKVYCQVLCLITLTSYFIGLMLVPISFFFFESSLFMKILSIIFFPVSIALIAFISGTYYPYQKIISRRKSIEMNLPFAISHMGAIAASGIPPSAVFKMIGRFEEYDVLAEEMNKITNNIESFGMDPVTAMKETAKRTPSQKFKQLLYGCVSTIESGGNLNLYLRNAGKETLFRWRMKRQRYLQQLSAYAEFYTGLLIAAPLFLISLFSVMNMIQPQLGGFGILQLMKLSIYIFVPALNIGFIFFLQITQIEM